MGRLLFLEAKNSILIIFFSRLVFNVYVQCFRVSSCFPEYSILVKVTRGGLIPLAATIISTHRCFWNLGCPSCMDQVNHFLVLDSLRIKSGRGEGHNFGELEGGGK
jgi:hypothetical protein